MAHNGASQQGKHLTSKQSQIVASIVSGRTQKQAGEECNVPLRTVARWCQLPQVKQAIRDGEDELADVQLRLVFRTITKSIATLNRQLDHPKFATAAAKVLLDLAVDLGKISKLETEVAKLEEQCLTSREGSMLITPLRQGLDSL